MDKKTEDKKTTQPKDDFAGIDFGDKRLTKRLRKTVANLTKSAKKSILSSGEGRSEAKAFYRLLSNEKFDFDQVIGVATGNTFLRMEGTVLLIQDTSDAVPCFLMTMSGKYCTALSIKPKYRRINLTAWLMPFDI